MTADGFKEQQPEQSKLASNIPSLLSLLGLKDMDFMIFSLIIIGEQAYGDGSSTLQAPSC